MSIRINSFQSYEPEPVKDYFFFFFAYYLSPNTYLFYAFSSKEEENVKVIFLLFRPTGFLVGSRPTLLFVLVSPAATLNYLPALVLFSVT